jgi:hypothetical protein
MGVCFSFFQSHVANASTDLVFLAQILQHSLWGEDRFLEKLKPNQKGRTMIHEWFMNFGGLAMLITVLAYIVTRTLARRGASTRNSDDKQGMAFLTILVGIVSILVLVVSFFLVCFGVTATIPGWIGFALLGAAFGLLSSN